MKIIDADALFESLIFPTEQFKAAFKQILDDEPAVDPSKCFEGMTNGEVFQATFPCDEVIVNNLQEVHVHFSMKNYLNLMICFDLEWWDAPYQERGE